MQSFTLVFGVVTFRCTILDLHLDNWSYDRRQFVWNHGLTLAGPWHRHETHSSLPINSNSPSCKKSNQRYASPYAAAQHSG